MTFYNLCQRNALRSQTSRPTTSDPADEAAIRTLYEQLMDGWNSGDGNAFAAPFAEDADFVAFDGSYFKGRQEIATFHQMLFDQFLRGTRLVGKVRSVRFLTPDVAVMNVVGGTAMLGQSELEAERNSIQTLVATKRAGEWHLATFQNSRAQYMGRPELAQALTEELRQLL
jgi:uncharacterized protein (TIGR02246 family)